MLHGLLLAAQDHVEARGLILHTIHFIVVSIGSIIAAIACALIAAAKGRSALGWGILGFFCSILTLIVVLVIPSKK